MSETSEPKFEFTFESLREQLATDDVSLRMKAVHASRSLPISERFNLLLTAAIDPNTRIRYDAVSQLGSVGQIDKQKSLEILSDRLLNDPEMDVKAAAADSLGSLQLTQAFDLLKTAYHSTNDWMFQFSIIAAIGELGAPEGFELLSEALQSPNELVKIAAIGSLGDLGNPEAVNILLNLIDDPDWQVRHRVSQSLAHLGGDDAKAGLEKLANDPVLQVAEATRLLLS
ncbi:HEAT repeat domain-containing protein [Pseudanabaena sp. FACHB-1998]|uniref:HEAT repeat domain-containing protein n=1 Tax=Pseudanabaena sp. FACHB-1998 TaxID=2692858 RepID=UPI001680FBF7|nr:HEAT repeat domain-containing protein [Pseudanabaena sp. FACHB-1998]